MPRRIARVLGRASLAVVITTGATVLTGSPAASASCANAFSSAFTADLAQRYPGIRVTAAVYDTQTGCWHHLHQGLQVTTASVIKAQVLGAVLLKAQGEGRGLTTWERSQIRPMIRYSFNPETSALYAHVGSAGGMHATDSRFGVTATSHTAVFGLTRTTALDRTRVALRLLHGGGGLGQAGRDEAWSYLTDVHPLQQWGISAGVPVGWTVAQKNGFYPSSGLGWRVGSSGFVRRDTADQGYAITVMTEGAGDQATGTRLVEEVARRAAAALTVGPGARRAIDRARCVGTSSGESWSGVAARLGLPASRAGDVRTVAGGNPSPLSGQRACSPSIPLEPASSTSVVNGRYLPAPTDLDCDGDTDIVWYGPGARSDALWRGGDRRFGPAGFSGGNDLVPLAGDFDGDGCGDIFWYGAGSRPDQVWFGGGSVTFASVAVDGLGYAPVVGDFDGDAHSDVLWYRPGSGADYVWYGGSARGTFASRAVKVNLAYVPVVGDFDGDRADDVFWYAPGAAAEYLWRGMVGARSFANAAPAEVNGRYRPIAADLDGDDADELLWYAPGGIADYRWDGLPSSLQQMGISVNGDYLPVAGDFDGDGYDDVVWYGPGTATDWAWWGGASGVTSRPLTRT